MGIAVHFALHFFLLSFPGSPNSPSVNMVLKVELVLLRQLLGLKRGE
jgi:hypothetical protein